VTDGNELMQPIHNRMPVLLNQRDFDLWLDPEMSDKDKLLPLLVPYQGNDLEAYPVSKAVNTPKNNRPELLEPVEAI